MQQKMMFAGAAALAVAAAMTAPGYAAVHHRIHHQAHSSQSTAAERQQTADLNRQQLAQGQANTAGTGVNVGSTSTGTTTQQNGLTTEPANYQHPGKSSRVPASMNSSAPSSMGSPSSESGAVQTPADAARDAEAQPNPDGTIPPPANPSRGSQ